MRANLATAGWAATFVACIALSNWALLHLGVDNGPEAPRTLPVGFGLEAPSGVLFAGILLTLRDFMHERIGTRRTIGIIVLSTPVTALIAEPALALASAATFLLAELADLTLYRWVRKHGLWPAVLASNLLSSLLDSAILLLLAFGVDVALDGFLAMTWGKLLASLLTLAAISLVTKLRTARAS